MIGIYTITNIQNNKVYVGSTTWNFQKRWWRHLSYLRRNLHKNTILQNSFNKYGEESFKFEILEECDKELCIGLEQYWINVLNSSNRKFGFNIRNLAKNNLGLRHSQETKNRMSISAKNHIRTEEHSKNLKLAIRRFRRSDFKIHKVKISKEERIKISIKNLSKVFEKYKNKKIYQFSLDNQFIKEWNSIKEICEFLHCKTSSSISNCLTGISKSGYGYKWKYKN